MWAKVIRENHEYYNVTFRVGYMNSDLIAGRVDGSMDIISATTDEVELGSDEEWEEELINNKEILKIKKPSEASFFIYHIILDSIKMHLNEPLSSIYIIEEEETKTKKVWVKRVKAFVNDKPIYLVITGRKFSNVFDVSISDLPCDICKELCERQVDKLSREIKANTIRLNGLTHVIQFLKKDKNAYVRKSRKKSRA